MQAVGAPLPLRAGPPAWPCRVLPPAPLGPPLEKNQGLGPGSCLSVPKTSWKETLATQSGGHRHRPPRTPAERSRHVFKVLSSLLCSVCGLARGEVGRTRQAAGLGRGETSVWKPPGRRALAGSVLLLRPLRTSPAALGPPRALAGRGTASKF